MADGAEVAIGALRSGAGQLSSDIRLVDVDAPEPTLPAGAVGAGAALRAEASPSPRDCGSPWSTTLQPNWCQQEAWSAGSSASKYPVLLRRRVRSARSTQGSRRLSQPQVRSGAARRPTSPTAKRGDKPDHPRRRAQLAGVASTPVLVPALPLATATREPADGSDEEQSVEAVLRAALQPPRTLAGAPRPASGAAPCSRPGSRASAPQALPQAVPRQASAGRPKALLRQASAPHPFPRAEPEPLGARHPPPQRDAVREAFGAYCGTQPDIDRRGFAKLCRDCRLVDEGFSDAHAESVFRDLLPAGAQRIGLRLFEEALRSIAERKAVALEAVRDSVASRARPALHRTRADRLRLQKNEDAAFLRSFGPLDTGAAIQRAVQAEALALRLG